MKHCSKRLALATLLLAACASNLIVVNGVEVHREVWGQTVAELRQRAAFNLDCPGAQAEFVLFKRVGKFPTEVGVKGCDRRATYVRTVAPGLVGPWVFNVGSETAPTASEASAKPCEMANGSQESAAPSAPAGQ